MPERTRCWGRGCELATFAQRSGATAAPNAPPAAVPGALPVARPSELTVAGVYESWANPASSTSMLMPLQVGLAFLTGSSFVALLGIGFGVALSVALSVGIVDSFEEQISGIRYTVPWSTLGVIVGLPYCASLLTTFLPAREASRLFPAEAVRVEGPDSKGGPSFRAWDRASLRPRADALYLAGY